MIVCALNSNFSSKKNLIKINNTESDYEIYQDIIVGYLEDKSVKNKTITNKKDEEKNEINPIEIKAEKELFDKQCSLRAPNSKVAQNQIFPCFNRFFKETRDLN